MQLCLSQSKKTIHHRGTEAQSFLFACAYGAINNKNFYSVLSVPLWFNIFFTVQPLFFLNQSLNFKQWLRLA